MQPTRTLPETYTLSGSLDLSKDRRALILLNVLGAPLFLLSGWLFILAALRLRPGEAGRVLVVQIFTIATVFRVILAALVLSIFMLVLHEVIHGLFFWFYTRARPSFGIGPGYAYARADGWFLPRGQYLVVSLAPLVIITLLGLALLALGPAAWLPAVIAVMTFNASGAVGDMAVALWLLKLPRAALAQDRGDAVDFYVPAKKALTGAS